MVDSTLADTDLAAGDAFQPTEHAQQRGLAAARGPDEHDELAIGDVQIDARQHVGLAVVGLAQVAEADSGHGL